MSEENLRYTPQSELDLNLMVTDSVWGKNEVPEELRSKLKMIYSKVTKEGNIEATEGSLWDMLGFYTRDMRLGHLSSFNGELESCNYHTNLAGDLLSEGMLEPFLICLRRVATVLELSQSKSGFLRKQMNTFREERVNTETEPPKKNLFGAGKPQGRY